MSRLGIIIAIIALISIALVGCGENQDENATVIESTDVYTQSNLEIKVGALAAGERVVFKRECNVT